MMLDYEEFIDEVAARLENQFGIRVGIETMYKNNTVKQGIVIRDEIEKSRISPVIYLDTLYAGYQDGVSLDRITKKAADLIEEGKKETLDIPPVNRQFAREHLVLSLINKDNNAAMLANIPHREFLDLAAIPKIKMDLPDGGNGMFVVQKEMLPLLQMTAEEVLECAENNTVKNGIRLESIGETMARLMMENGMPEEDVKEILGETGTMQDMYVLSNRECSEGAAVMADMAVLDYAHDYLKGDFYILPSSIHEVLLVPVDCGISIQELEAMVSEVNAEEVQPKDRLSDRVYKYDGHKLMMAGEEETVLHAPDKNEKSKGKHR